VYTWPTHFPSQCPPEDATEISGKIFRLISRDGPKEFDFQSHYERAPGAVRTETECISRGLSVLRSYHDCEVLMDAVPALRKKLVAEANLETGTGLIGETPSGNCAGHCTWWRSVTVEEACSLFSLKASTAGAEK
tara:strand:+ start:507 stop:911 length:405 start_codon:yes stop_codon:yes gene_type:complete